MSSARLLFSGSLVASGLILGAFTLHGTFDQGAARRGPQPQQPQAEPRGISAFQTRTQVVPGEKAAQDATPHPALVTTASTKSDTTPEPKAADAMSPEEKAARAAARRKLAEKRRAEKAEKEKVEREKLAKAKQQPPPQQATAQWPWSWFGNN
jgi:hypothetical protein